MLPKQLYNNTQRRWLSLQQDTFIFTDQYKLLLFNIHSGESYEVSLDHFFIHLAEQLDNIENLYCIEVSDKEYNTYTVFFQAISQLNLGKITYATYLNRPIILPPKLKLNYDLTRIKRDYAKQQAGYILKFINEFTIYLNDSYSDNQFYKQTLYPVEGNNQVSDPEVIALIEQAKYSGLVSVNLICDTIAQWEIHKELIEYLNKTDYVINYYIRYTFEVKYIKVHPSHQLHIVCSAEHLPRVISNAKYLFLVSNEKELQQLNATIPNGTVYEILPVYTGQNYDFFYKNVFICKEDLRSLNKLKRIILVNMEINSNFFGKLTILPNRQVYSNLNFKSIGNISDSLYDLIYKALDYDQSWLFSRNKAQPCKNCRYRFLCPPISNYELVIGKNNLCTINEPSNS